jgi:hypothetical protein
MDSGRCQWYWQRPRSWLVHLNKRGANGILKRSLHNAARVGADGGSTKTPPRRGAARGGTRIVPVVLATCVHDSAFINMRKLTTVLKVGLHARARRADAGGVA